MYEGAKESDKRRKKSRKRRCKSNINNNQGRSDGNRGRKLVKSEVIINVRERKKGGRKIIKLMMSGEIGNRKMRSMKVNLGK